MAAAISSSKDRSPEGSRPDTMADVLGRLKTAEQSGVVYLRDHLDSSVANPAKLTVHTLLADPAQCGRRARGWLVNAGLADSYTYVVLRDAPMLGNRSQWSQFSFVSRQEGIAAGEHGLVEMRLCRGTTASDLPLRIRIENGYFYILGLNADTVLAGARETRRVTLSAGTVYTLAVLLFEKAVFARLTGADLPGGAIELVIPDRRRFIPGYPGFGLRPNARATSGDLTIFGWNVSPVGPAENCLLGAIGDSITAGNDGEPESESYVAMATAALGQDLVLNAGSGGSTTALDAGRFPFEVAPFKPAIAWIEGGTNDIGNGISADEAFANMARQAEMVTWGGRAVFSTVPPRQLATADQAKQLSRLNRLVRESGRPFVDRHAIVSDPADPARLRAEFDHRDHIHVTPAGHALIAAEATRIFRQLA